MRVKRYLAVTAAAVALTATACVGTASAATTAKPPAPHCNPWSDAGNGWPVCTCPHGWKVHYPPFWAFWETVSCVEKK